jgi:hypothetical protein
VTKEETVIKTLKSASDLTLDSLHRTGIDPDRVFFLGHVGRGALSKLLARVLDPHPIIAPPVVQEFAKGFGKRWALRALMGPGLQDESRALVGIIISPLSPREVADLDSLLGAKVGEAIRRIPGLNPKTKRQ